MKHATAWRVDNFTILQNIISDLNKFRKLEQT